MQTEADLKLKWMITKFSSRLVARAGIGDYELHAELVNEATEATFYVRNARGPITEGAWKGQGHDRYMVVFPRKASSLLAAQVAAEAVAAEHARKVFGAFLDAR